MPNRFRPCILILAMSSACALWAPLAGQSPAGDGAEPGSPDVCAIVTHDEVKQLSEDPMVKFWTEPEATMVAGGEEPVEQVRPRVEALARLVVSKLR
jgi:hypothetical protein